MMRTLTVAKQYLAAAFVILIGLMSSGCGDSATVNPVVELASLGVDPGTLQPAFSGGTTQYTVDLSSNITSVTVTAQPAVSGDTVTINGQPTTNSVIPLGAAGTTTPVSIVVSETGTNSRTYTILLVRAGLTGNNSLQNLTLSSGTLTPAFDPNVQVYTVDVANNVGTIAMTPTLSDPAATMTVNGQPTGSGQAQTITLGPAGQSTIIPIVVTAQNGSPKSYQVTVSRGVSANNNLQSLTVSPGTLNPTFSANRTSYTVNVASGATEVTVTPRMQDAAATMTVNGQATNSGQARTIQLGGPGSNTPVFIIVTAQNGTQKTYTVGVTRAALGGNNNLSALTVSPGTLNPAFNANTLSYTVDVASSVTSVSVTPTRQDSNATITVNGQAATSGQARTIQLGGPGSNTPILIIVTAQNGSQKTYTVGVNRAALGGNNNLSALTVSPGNLDPDFDEDTLVYSINVGSNVGSVSVTPTRQDSNATITVNGQATTSGQARTVNLNPAGQTTIIPIVVTAQNGSQKTYTVNVVRAALGGNNNLSALAISPGTLTPAFTAARTSYTANVGSGVDSVTVTATKSDSNASMTINGQGTNSGQARSISLGAPGSNTEIDITVVAPNGTPRIYTVNVSRGALGGNNNLSALTISPGTLSPAFTAARTSYTANVGSGVDSVTVTATLQDTSASMTVNGQGTNSGQARSISLGAAGTSTEIEIIVTAPNGDQKFYTVTVNRSALTAPPAPASAPDLIPEDDSCPRDTVTNECLPGTSDADNITNINTPRFRITQPGTGETPSLHVDGNKVDSTFNQAANTLQPTAALSDGDHEITYTVTNAGGESSQSPSLTVTIDTVAPGGP
jgi:hypothetical protein